MVDVIRRIVETVLKPKAAVAQTVVAAVEL